MVQGLNLDFRSEFFTIWLSVNLEFQSPAESSPNSQLSTSVAEIPVHTASIAQVKDLEPTTHDVLPLSLLEASPGAKIQQVGCHRAAYQEHLKEQAAESSQKAQVEQHMSLSCNTMLLCHKTP